MPAPPELADGARHIRQIEIFGKVEPEQLAKPDCHIRISAEIKINLQRVADSPQPGKPEIQRVCRERENRVGNLARRVRQQHLFRKAADEAPHAGERPPGGTLAAVDLRRNIVVFDDRPRDQLREKRDVQQQLAEAFRALAGRAVNVDDIAEPLEGVKRNPDRQHDAGRRERKAEQPVQGEHEEIKVLERPERQQVRGGRKRQDAPAVRPCAHEQPPEYVVRQHACAEQQGILRLAEGVKHHARKRQPRILQPHGQHKGNQADGREKDEQENR